MGRTKQLTTEKYLFLLQPCDLKKEKKNKKKKTEKQPPPRKKQTTFTYCIYKYINKQTNNKRKWPKRWELIWVRPTPASVSSNMEKSKSSPTTKAIVRLHLMWPSPILRD